MRFSDIKIGKAYVLKSGALGRVIAPHSKNYVKFRAVFPVPRESMVTGKDVDREVTKAEVPAAFHSILFD